MLEQQGRITPDEYQRMKNRIIGEPTPRAA
jgi:hypothetical protein